MSDPIRDATPEALMRQSAWLTALARQLVKEPHGAEDVAQEAWLAALRRAPIARPRAWLARVVHHVAATRRTRDKRRAQRETAARRGEAEPSTLDVVIRAREQQRVVEAILALAEPYRSTVLMRYFDGLPPRAIAARAGIPVATVHTRLRRALERLRAALDAEFGDRRAWLAVLLPLTIMKTKLIVAAAAIVVATAVILTSNGAPRPTPASAEIGGATSPPAVAGDARPAGATAVAPPDGAAPSRTALLPATKERVRISGRCVDAADGLPLTGIRVELRARAPLRLLATGAAATFEPPPAVRTGADGRFAIEFDAVARWSVSLAISGDGVVPVSSGHVTLDGAAAYDCGDVPLLLGCRVAGRVVDAAGAAVADEPLLVVPADSPLARENPEDAEFGEPSPEQPSIADFSTRRMILTETAADGTFAVESPIAPDTWIVRPATRRRVVEGGGLRIERGQASAWVDVVTERAVGGLSGVVVDDAGQPVPEATVRFSLASGEEGRLSTDALGRFELARFARDAGDAVRLRAGKRGYDGPGEVEHRWETGIELVLERRAGVVVTVTDAESGAPVVEFGVRCFRRRFDGSVTMDESFLRHVGDHPSGRAEYPGVPPGPHVVRVEPARSDLAASWLEPIEVERGAANELHVVLQRRVFRVVEVVDASGSAISGARVALVRGIAPDTSVTPSTRLLRGALWPGLRAEDAIVLDEGATGADGRVELGCAPMDSVHARVEVDTVTVAGPFAMGTGLAPLRVVVGAPARVEGVLGPPEAVGALDPWLSLVRSEEAAPSAWSGAAPPVRVGADGAFDFVAESPGDWSVVLRDPLLGPVVLANVEDLRAGETRRLTIDVARWVPGRLRGTVHVLGGEPRNARAVSVERTPGRSVTARSLYGPAEIDPDGRFELRVPAGRYRLSVEIPGPADAQPVSMVGADVVEVLPGNVTAHTFRLERHRATLRLRGPDGQPLGDTPVLVLWEGSAWPVYGARTDADATLVVDPAPPGPFRVAVWPPELATSDAQRRHREANPDDWPAVLWTSAPVQATGTASDPLDVVLLAH